MKLQFGADNAVMSAEKAEDQKALTIHQLSRHFTPLVICRTRKNKVFNKMNGIHPLENMNIFSHYTLFRLTLWHSWDHLYFCFFNCHSHSNKHQLPAMFIISYRVISLLPLHIGKKVTKSRGYKYNCALRILIPHNTELNSRPIGQLFSDCCNYSTYLLDPSIYCAAYVLSLASESRLSKKKRDHSEIREHSSFSLSTCKS